MNRETHELFKLASTRWEKWMETMQSGADCDKYKEVGKHFAERHNLEPYSEMVLMFVGMCAGIDGR